MATPGPGHSTAHPGPQLASRCGSLHSSRSCLAFSDMTDHWRSRGYLGQRYQTPMCTELTWESRGNADSDSVFLRWSFITLSASLIYSQVTLLFHEPHLEEQGSMTDVWKGAIQDENLASVLGPDHHFTCGVHMASGRHASVWSTGGLRTCPCGCRARVAGVG